MTEVGPGSLPVRLLKVFFSPGELFRGLKEDPRWLGALLAGAVLVALVLLLVPAELWVQAMRERAAARGGEIPPFLTNMGPLLRAVTALSALLFYFLWVFVLAGVVTFVFAFLFGDEVTYRQYLSVVAHGLFITAVGGFLLLPLKILQGDPELTLNVGTFFYFLEEGYVYRVLRVLDLFSLWGFVVMGVGVAEMAPRRTPASAITVFLVLNLVVALLVGLIPR